MKKIILFFITFVFTANSFAQDVKQKNALQIMQTFQNQQK